MTRLVHRPIMVTLQNDEPHSFVDAEHHHVITEIVDRWMESGAWWLDEPGRHLYRVITSEAYMFDIERIADSWFIYRVWD